MTPKTHARIALAALVGAALVAAGCASAPLQGPRAATTSGSGGRASVALEDSQYAPATLTVGVGTTVTWTNRDPYTHTVTPTDKAQWGSQGSGDGVASWLKEGQTWSFTFAKPGTYKYYCIPHASRSGGEWKGMVGTVVVSETAATPSPAAAPRREPVPDVTVVPSPVAPARMLPGADGVVRIALEAREVKAQLTDDAGYEFWTFGGTVPGPMLRVRQGDRVELSLSNAADSRFPHSIDLHAVTGPGGGAKATQTAPGERTSFEFRALNPGLFVYHCATAHIPTHVANGMYGLILVEPPEGLPDVDREYFVVQGEAYTDGARGAAGMQAFDADKMLDERPTYVLMNGRVGALTGAGALQADVGETVRLYVGVGGFVPSNFHVIGEIFDKVYPEAGFPAVEHVQTTFIPAGGSTMVEFRVEVPGTYLLVDHALPRAIDRGAVGALVVSGAEDPAVFDGGGAGGGR